MKPNTLILNEKALEALSYVIVTATEGGFYTREDYIKWSAYKHKETDAGFYAEVTLHPHGDVVEGVDETPIRMTPQELGNRLYDRFDLKKFGTQKALEMLRLFNGDEDIAGELDVIDAGALLQIAVYGDIIFG